MQEIKAVVSLTNIKKNVSVFKRLLGDKKLFAVVKANAYGHGAVRVAEEIEPLVQGFCVATVKEGVALRAGGIKKDILVFTPPLDEADAYSISAHGMIATVASLNSLKVCAQAAKKYASILRVHVKADTGMNRSGVYGEAFLTLVKRAKNAKGLSVEGLYSHLYYPSDPARSLRQKERFDKCIAVAKAYFPQIECHLSATGGVRFGKPFFYDGVRLGIGLYGYFPYGVEKYVFLKPAMKVYAPVVQTHPFTGGGIGYNVAKGDHGDLSFIRLGYADGYPRNSGVLGAEGNICMDGLVVDGKKRGRVLVFEDADELAKKQNTIACEVLCNATRRSEIEYV